MENQSFLLLVAALSDFSLPQKKQSYSQSIEETFFQAIDFEYFNNPVLVAAFLVEWPFLGGHFNIFKFIGDHIA